VLVGRKRLLSRAVIALLTSVTAAVVLSGCFSDGRSAKAVCKVWDTDGLAVHDQFNQTGSQASSDLPGALANLAGAPGRVADLMDKMAGVAPSDVEPAFKTLANAFRTMGNKEGQGVTDPLGALAGALAAGFTAQGSIDTVNNFLSQHCGVPSG
jgi:hypothetical protein